MCTDSRTFDVVVTQKCNGAFQNKVYTWSIVDMVTPPGSDTAQPVVTSAGHWTCAPENSEFAFLLRDSTAASTTNRELSAEEVSAYAARTATDAVSADQASATQLCKEYGASGVHTASACTARTPSRNGMRPR